MRTSPSSIAFGSAASAGQVVRLAILVALLFAICPRPARGEIRGGESIEWIAVDADLVVRCRLVGLVGDESTPGSSWRCATFEISDTLKGPALARLTTRADVNDRDLSEWRNAGGERIVFFTRTERDAETDGRADDAERAKYPYRLRTQWQWQLVGRVGEQLRCAFTADGRVLRDPPAIESALREAIASPAKPVTPASVPDDNPFFDGARLEHDRWSYRLDATFGSEVGQELWSGSAVFLTVPLDDRLEQRALARYDAGEHDLSVLRMLRYFKDARTIAVMRAALSDRGDGTSGYAGPGQRWYYESRSLAYAMLARWGEIVPRPATEMPDDGYRRVTAATIAGGMLAPLVVLLATYAILRRAGRATIVDAACLSALLFAGAYVALVWRDPWSVREVTFGGADARYWAWLDSRGATLLHAADWPEPVDVSYGTFDKRDAPYGRWENGWANGGWRHAGVRWMTGPMQAAGRDGRPPPASATVGLAVPSWAIAALLALPPLARATTLASAAVRGRSRRRRGECLACGYDLRGGHARCPECGATDRATTRDDATIADGSGARVARVARVAREALTP